MFYFFISVYLLVDGRGSLLIFKFSTYFYLYLPTLFSTLFRQEFQREGMILPGQLSKHFFCFSLCTTTFLFTVSMFRWVLSLVFTPSGERGIGLVVSVKGAMTGMTLFSQASVMRIICSSGRSLSSLRTIYGGCSIQGTVITAIVSLGRYILTRLGGVPIPIL